VNCFSLHTRNSCDDTNDGDDDIITMAAATAAALPMTAKVVWFIITAIFIILTIFILFGDVTETGSIRGGFQHQHSSRTGIAGFVDIDGGTCTLRSSTGNGDADNAANGSRQLQLHRHRNYILHIVDNPVSCDDAAAAVVESSSSTATCKPPRLRTSLHEDNLAEDRILREQCHPYKQQQQQQQQHRSSIGCDTSRTSMWVFEPTPDMPSHFYLQLSEQLPAIEVNLTY